jgi:hypothetical protein
MTLIVVRVVCCQGVVLDTGDCYRAIVLFLAVSFLSACAAGVPGFAHDQAVLSDEVIRIHLQFNGLSLQSIHVTGFGGQKFGVM